MGERSIYRSIYEARKLRPVAAPGAFILISEACFEPGTKSKKNIPKERDGEARRDAARRKG